MTDALCHVLNEILGGLRSLQSRLGDWLMNVDTGGSMRFRSERGLNMDAFDFETISHAAIMRTIRLVRPRATDIVYVLGSGKGRAVCHFARRPVQKVVGIEISGELCQEARKNVKQVRFARTSIEIRNADVAQSDLRDGTIYFMFNPFGEKTLRSVLRNIEDTHRGLEEQLRVIYVNPVYRHVLDTCRWLSVLHDYRRIRGGRVLIYQGRKLARLSGENQQESVVCLAHSG